MRRPLLIPIAATLSLALSLSWAASALAAAKPRAPRKASLRTGLIVTRDDELVRTVRKKDRGAIERLAERMGPSHLAEALASPDTSVVEAALIALPLSRGAVLLMGSVADLLDSSSVLVASGAARVLGQLLDGSEPDAIEDWEVPADQVEHACGALRGLAGRVEAPVSSRVAALGAIASASTVCTATGELTGLLRDPVPAVRRAAALVLHPDERRAASALREVIRDPERSVASAAVATLCRGEPGDLANGGALASKAEIPPQPVIDVARALVVARTTNVADAVEMLGCIARAATPADRQILDQLRRGPASALRDRAVELISAPDRLKSQ